MHRTRSALLATALGLAATPGLTAPSRPEVAGALELRLRGNAAMKAGRPAEALALYKASRAKAPQPEQLYNIGRALEALGRNPEALEWLRRFKEEAPRRLLHRARGLDQLLRALAGKVHRLTVKLNVGAARVRFIDRELGLMKNGDIAVVNGRDGTLRVEAEGYLPASRRLELAPGEASTVAFELKKKPELALLRVEGTPEAAAVAIDGMDRGELPLELELTPGKHLLRVMKEGFDPVERSLRLTPGRRTEQVALERSTPVTHRWWFWAAIGAAVVAVATTATVVALSNGNDDAARGSIEPGRVEF